MRGVEYEVPPIAPDVPKTVTLHAPSLADIEAGRAVVVRRAEHRGPVRIFFDGKSLDLVEGEAVTLEASVVPPLPGEPEPLYPSTFWKLTSR